MSTLDLTRYSTIQQTTAHGKVSDKYAFIPTTRPLAVFADHGWFPAKIQQAGASPENRGYQKHIVRLRHPDFSNGEDFPEICMINGHMGNSRFKLFLGWFRTICLNGLITGDIQEQHSIRHIGYADDKVDAAIKSLLGTAARTIPQVESLKSIQLERPEQIAYAESAIEMAWVDGKYAVRPDHVLSVRRFDDKKSDLWTTFNRVQENIIKGGIPQYRADGSRIRSKQVKSIDKDVKLNQALWTLTEKMHELKLAQ